eukprot:3181854-Prymnesium_polylepis.1
MGRMIKNEYNEKDIIRKLISLIQNGIIAYDEDACMPRQQLTMLLYFHHPILLVSVAPYLTNVRTLESTNRVHDRVELDNVLIKGVVQHSVGAIFSQDTLSDFGIGYYRGNIMGISHSADVDNLSVQWKSTSRPEFMAARTILREKRNV